MLKYAQLIFHDLRLFMATQASTKSIPMIKMTRFALAASLFFAAPFAFACDYPERPQIPDGGTASKEELLTAKTDVTNYLTGVDDYLRCIEAEEKAAREAMEDADPAVMQNRDELLDKKFDAANEEKALVGEQFNQQVRAYNAKKKASQ
jgi:hypothetical protein